MLNRTAEQSFERGMEVEGGGLAARPEWTHAPGPRHTLEIVGRYDLGQQITQLGLAANRAGVTVYAVDAEGDHFSFGASVPEHMPGAFEKMIPAFGNRPRVLGARIPWRAK